MPVIDGVLVGVRDEVELSVCIPDIDPRLDELGANDTLGVSVSVVLDEGVTVAVVEPDTDEDTLLVADGTDAVP